jgi:hypothetical protein
VGLAVVPGVLGGGLVAVEPGQDGGEEEEDAVHDAEGEAGLEHGAGLVGADRDAVAVEVAEDAEVDVVLVAGGDVGTVGAADPAEVVDCCDECADEACGGRRRRRRRRMLATEMREVQCVCVGCVPRSTTATKAALELLLW